MIELRKVNVHNLKDLDLDLPTGKLIVFHGRSGSGKTSLAIDTLYAEGQRRYIETFSTDARRFLEKLEKPNVERISGLPPAVAVTQNTFAKTTTQTVGTATEVSDYLELLAAKVGQRFCPQCGREIKIDTPQTILDAWKKSCLDPKTRLQIAFKPFSVADLPSINDFLSEWKERGFVRGLINNTPFRLDEDNSALSLRTDSDVLLIVDRLTFDSGDERIIDSLETAFDYGKGNCAVLMNDERQTFTRRLSCPDCPKTQEKFSPAVLLNEKSIEQLEAMNVAALKEFLQTLKLTEHQRRSARNSLEQLVNRLDFLIETGLAYLTPDRLVKTLSGGEQRRVGLTTVLSSTLVNVLYILDEPTLGLHPTEAEKVLHAVQKLRDRGNTVIAVEHNETFIQAADFRVEFGHEPVILAPETSPISGANAAGSYGGSDVLTITNCRGNNLRNIDVSFPLGGLCAVAGVSGAGKSSLVLDTLYPALCRYFGKKNPPDGLPFDILSVPDTLQDVIMIDTEPMGKSARSNAATYLKVFDEVRTVFASQLEAKARNFTAGMFSFNTAGGRCEHCQGNGFLTVDLQFLPDMTVRCPECQGQRYRPEILEVLYRGKNINEVLSMTAREAFSFFRGQNAVQKKIKPLLDVGLDYLQLGQPANTLSGGESQRLKLAAYLSQIKKERTLILMDEPTAGLHRDDVGQLLACFRALIQTGHSLLVIEHNAQMIHAADFVFEL
jgi:excinuclease ABC subunit A